MYTNNTKVKLRFKNPFKEAKILIVNSCTKNAKEISVNYKILKGIFFPLYNQT